MKSDSADGIRGGAPSGYTASVGLYRCPSDKSLWSYGTRRAPHLFDVALSVAMNGAFNGDNGKALHPMIVEKLAEIRLPGRVFTFMDEEDASMASGAFFEQLDQTDFWWMVPGGWDQGCGANVAFADGHVRFRKWPYLGRTRTGPTTYVQNELDRADLAWVLGAIPSVKDP